MNRYFVSMYTDGPATRWQAIDRRSQDIVAVFATEEEAKSRAEKLNDGQNWIDLRNELDRTRAERDSWEAQFHSAAAAASEYSEFWEKHHGDFDQFGNYIPYSQIDGDLRAAKAEIERLRAAVGGGQQP